MFDLETILKPHTYKNQIWSIMNQIRKPLLKSAYSFPFISKCIDLPKGHYASSVEYSQVCKTENLSDVIYRKFLPPFVSHRNPPKSIDEEIHWKFDGRYKHSNPETFVISIPNGRVIGKAGTILTHDDKLLLDASGVDSIKNYIFPYLKRPKCELIQETVAVLATGAGGKYYHWLLEALPRLEILRKTIPGGLDSIDKFIVNKGVSAITESLEILGIPSNKLLFCGSDSYIQAVSLVVPSLPGSTGDPPSWVSTFFRENFSNLRKDINLPARLYISRAKAGYRKVRNEESVIKCLSNYEFTTVHLEDYSFTKQIALLSNAKVIVAPHGAGLSNLVWCNPEAKILEIFSPNYVNVCFWAIANQVGLDYFYLIGDGQKIPNCIDPHLVQDDITVSIEKLSLTLEAVLK